MTEPMIEYELTSADLASVRFVISPLSEAVLSLRVVQNPARYPFHQAWVRQLPELRQLPDFGILLSSLTSRGWSPDFLSPIPPAPYACFDDELARVAGTDPEQVQADLAAISSPVRREGAPSVRTATELLSRLVSGLQAYWTAAIEPHWQQFRAVLEADIGYRSRVCARDGLGAMFSGLSDRLSFTPPLVRVEIPGALSRHVVTDGGGLALMPSLFALHTAVPANPAGPPLIVYGARGVATVWEEVSPIPSAALANVLGETRAGLLTRLAEPASSSQLARRLGISVSAVNQHLRALRAVGLLQSTRVGRSVEYRRTALAEEMLKDLASSMPPR
ncbi:ArsR/SmtB family transcription factor [Kribbella monticola]|uniref:ArsR/SmtB family transcription factor n=1 Tax=Kribbella monticola TaxID=2185285 RepID=UPI000DD36B77|nr:helix-turn-helix domain-containing protein [Kribbella monticola]